MKIFEIIKVLDLQTSLLYLLFAKRGKHIKLLSLSTFFFCYFTFFYKSNTL